MNRLLRYSLLGAGLVFAAHASAVGTRRFSLEKSSDFKGGDLKGVAVDSAGHVRAGFNLGSVPVLQGTSIWSALPMRDGSVLLGTGNEGKLLKLSGGAVSVLAETKALVVTSLVEAWGGAVVLGTLPDGKVMKWDHGKLSDLVTLKGTEHVWQVAFDEKKKVLYAATGPEGKLYRISETGDAQVYFDAPEQHLMSVAVAPDGTVYAGASDKAKLYKITAPGHASVLYDFGRTEVRAIAVNKKGDVFAIANEIKPGNQAPSRHSEGTPAQPTNTAPKTKGKGTLYKFSSDGTPDQLLDDTDEHYTSLALGDDGRPYVGTGVEGRVYTVDANHNSVLVADVDERQVGALVLTGKEQLVVASDPAVVHPIKGIGGPDAVWTSKVLDAGLRARFGKITWEATGPLQVSTRTGNTKDPDDTWSAWSAGFGAPSLTDSPAARYLQVRARFDKDPNTVLSEIGVSFLTDNLRAVITAVDAKDTDSSESDDSIHSSGGPVTWSGFNWPTITSWKVDNPDKDDLRYRLQYRQVGSNTWFDLLKPQEKLTKDSYSWETSDLPEGRYRVRVVATDELSNPPDRVTRDEMESSVVLVDNTPPVIEGLKVVGKQRPQGVAIDGVGPIARIEISLAGSDEWTPFYPTDGIFDEQREEFDADVSKLALRPPRS